MHAKPGHQRKRGVAAQFVLEGESRANEGLSMLPELMSQICADVDVILFEPFLEESAGMAAKSSHPRCLFWDLGS